MARYCGNKTAFLSLLLAIFMLSACGNQPAVGASPSDRNVNISIYDFSPSPDGRIIAFDFASGRGGMGKGHHGVGLYDWQTGTVTRVPDPPGRHISDPSFSHDGKTLAVASQDTSSPFTTEIAVIDLATMVATQITNAPYEIGHSGALLKRDKRSPIFQPGDENILYVDFGMFRHQHLRIINIIDKSEKVVLRNEDGFYAILSPFFVGKEEAYFGGIGPENKELLDDIKRMGVNVGGGRACYGLKFDEATRVVFKDIQEKLLHNGDVNINSLTGSIDGSAFVFIKVVDPAKPGPWELDIFRLNMTGKITRLTTLRSHLAFARISDDGSMVAFGADPARDKAFDLYVLDMRTNRVTETHLLQKLKINPDF